MHAIQRTLPRFIRTTADKGASAVEYGLMVAAIAAVVIGSVFALGGMVSGVFSKTSSCISVSNPTAATC